jgi:tungstate transport system substrate-binding protein
MENDIRFNRARWRYIFFSVAQPVAQEKSIVVASTTSTQDSGLFKYLLPIFQTKTGIAVKVIALGTGQVLDIGRRGDADVGSCIPHLQV